jgi:hypothetical protein
MSGDYIEMQFPAMEEAFSGFSLTIEIISLISINFIPGFPGKRVCEDVVLDSG